MKLLVCMKQVPDTTEIKIDPVNNTLIRAGVPSIMNPFDACALELALCLREREGGTVTAVTMGPAQAVAILKDALSMGADEAFLVSDRAFGGSDTLATSYILSRTATYLGGFDLILCGKQAIDGDTGQVAPEIAEHLGLAQVTYCRELSIQSGKLCAVRESDGYRTLVETALPAVVSVVRGDTVPRFQRIADRLRANRTDIRIISQTELNLAPAHIGLKGSPTKVKKTFTPPRSAGGIPIEGESAAGRAQTLVEHLRAAQVL